MYLGKTWIQHSDAASELQAPNFSRSYVTMMQEKA